MEPILQNPQFSKLFKIWEFLTAYYQYLDLPETLGQISLYELANHIEHTKHMTSLVSQIIKALVTKATGYEKTAKHHSTVLFMARNNKFKFFEDLVKTSYYQLGHSQISFSLTWRNLPQIDGSIPFEALKDQDKYRYLICLINLVIFGPDFKNDFMEALKKQYALACQQKDKNKANLYQTYKIRLQPSIILGKNEDNIYFYISKINDSIFCYNNAKSQWKRIIGQENVKKQIIDKLIKKPSTLTQSSLDLLGNVEQIWKKLEYPQVNNAFDKKKRCFDLKQKAQTYNKLQNVKLKMKELDELYSKFVGDCYNFRWAPKQKRIQFHNRIDSAEQIKDLVACFSTFFHQTKHTIQKSINTLKLYDYNLNTPEAPQGQFKGMFLRMNYLYVKDVIAEYPNSKSYKVNLYHHVKTFLQSQDDFSLYFYEYLMTFLGCMIGIINQMYPNAYQRRIKYLQKLKEQNQVKQEKQAEEKRNVTRSRLKRDNQPAQQQSSQQEQQSSATAQKNQSLKGLNGRRLRQKVRVNYSTKVVNQKSKSKSTKASNVAKTCNQPKRNGKKSKMILDSDSQQSQVEVSLSESDTQKQEKGLNLDSYKFVEQDDTQKFRRTLRSSKGKS